MKKVNNYNRMKIAVICIAAIIFLLHYIQGIPGYDTPSYISVANDFINSDIEGKKEMILTYEYSNAVNLIFLLIVSGNSGKNLELVVPYYLCFFFILSCYLIMDISHQIFTSEKGSLLSGLLFSFSPSIHNAYLNLFKQNISIAFLLLSILFLIKFLKCFENFEWNSIKKIKNYDRKTWFYLLISLFSNIIAIAYYNFFILEAILCGVTFLLYSVFILFPSFFLINAANSLINWHLVRISDITAIFNPVFYTQFINNFLYLPFIFLALVKIIEMLHIAEKKRVSLKIIFYKSSLIILIEGFLLSFSGIFGLFPEPFPTRFVQLLEYPLIFYCPLGIDYVFKFYNSAKKKKMGKVSIEKYFYVILIICCSINYSLSFSIVSKPAMSEKEEEAINYIKSSVKSSNPLNISIITHYYLISWMNYKNNYSKDSETTYSFTDMVEYSMNSNGSNNYIKNISINNNLSDTQEMYYRIYYDLKNNHKIYSIFFLWSKEQTKRSIEFGSFEMDEFYTFLLEKDEEITLVYNNGFSSVYLLNFPNNSSL
jgi:hypothetical protein